MLSLTIIDQLHLDLEQVAHNYQVHALASERLARYAFKDRIVVLLLLAVAMAAAIGNLVFRTRADEVAAIVSSALALIAFALHAALGLDARVHTHRLFAHRLWLIGESWRSLIAEADEGLVDRDVLIRRRTALIDCLHAAYGHGFEPDESGYETERAMPLSRAPAA